MPDLITSLIYLYADDAKLLNKGCVDNASLQSDLDTLCEWSMQWQLKFNMEVSIHRAGPVSRVTKMTIHRASPVSKKNDYTQGRRCVKHRAESIS